MSSAPAETTGPVAGIKPADLPAPPREAIRIVHACSRPDIDSRQLAAIITHDPVLTAELLRVANSPFFGFRTRVRSAAHAVTLLGQQAVRNMALCIAMRDALRKDAIPGLDVQDFWELALRRAVSARQLAELAGLDADECFTAGLLQDFGMLVLFYLFQYQVPQWPRLRCLMPDDRHAQERLLFRMTHDQVGRMLADTWRLPPELAGAIGGHHAEPSAEADGLADRLAVLCRCADWMAAVFGAEDKRFAVQQCVAMVGASYGIGHEQVQQLLGGIERGMEEAAAALGFRIAEQPSFEAVLREANLRLAEDNLTYQELTWRLEKALEERDRLAAELNRELELAREVQFSLLPPPEAECAGLYGINVAAREVSGDFYDFFRLKDGRIYFCIADVSGKGMNAALLMAKTSALFHCLGKGISDPAALLAMLNREICEKSVRGMFVTMVAGVYQPGSGEVMLANAGHLPVARLQPAGAVRLYPSEAPPLGISPEIGFPGTTFTLAEDSLYLFTDGLTDLCAGGYDPVGVDRLTTIIRQHSPRPASQRLRHILADVQARAAEACDDLTLLLLDGSVASA